jgi:glycosyltransferase involved in cell wall biosynthesis
MRIGIVLGRIGGVDGVALETDKWIHVLRRMGHEVRILTGELEAPREGAEVLPGLAFGAEATVREQRDAFLEPGRPEAEVVAEVVERAEELASGIEEWMRRERVDVLLSENATALPYHLSLGVALTRVYQRTGVRGLAHDHDFAWERGERYASPYAGIRELVEECYPPRLENLAHAVINSYARDTLKERFDIDSVVVPNVMDFEEPFAARDEVNAGMLADLGLPEDAVPLFQVTRIVRRKGIETAIDLVGRLGDPRVHLVVTGQANDDFSEDYLAELQDQAARLGLAERVHFVGHRFAVERGEGPDGEILYGLEDAYARAAAMTYFSTYEGFGNAFVEAVLARVPVFVNDYEPVYWPDIGSRGFETVMVRGGELTDEAVAAARAVLVDPELRAAQVERNFELGREHFSYEVLERLLTGILE